MLKEGYSAALCYTMEAEDKHKLLEVCRLCLIPKDNVVHLFEFDDSTKHCWANAINYALDVKVMQRDNLPSKGCSACIGKVKFAVPFKNTCLRSDAQLRGMPLAEETVATIARGVHKTSDKSACVVIMSKSDQVSTNLCKSSQTETKGYVCRLCLRRDYSVLDLFKNAPMQDVTLNEVVSFSLGIKAFEEDGFPKTICSLCVGKLYVLHNFKKQFLDSSKILFLPLEPKAKVDGDFDAGIGGLPETNSVLSASNKLTCVNPPLSDINLHTCPECNEVNCRNNIDQFMGCQPSIERMKCIGGSTNGYQPLLPVTVDVKNVENTQLGSRELPELDEKGRKLTARGEEYPGEPTWSNYVFKCGACGKQYPRKSSAIEHARTHVNIKLMIFKERKDRRYPCDMCARVYQTKSSLNNHKTTHGERKFCCRLCQRKFHNSNGLRLHLLIHSAERPFHCDQCPAKFRTKEALKVHMLRHNGDKKFLCDRCPIRFYSKCLLDRHILSHTGEKPHSCPVCFRCFSLKVNLTYHMRTHSGEKPYTCAHCLRSFSMKCSLGEHTKIHTGVRPYPCTSCGKAFKSVSAMHKHSTMHKANMELKCHVCLNSFSSRKLLRVHLKSEHDVG